MVVMWVIRCRNVFRKVIFILLLRNVVRLLWKFVVNRWVIMLFIVLMVRFKLCVWIMNLVIVCWWKMVRLLLINVLR